MFDIEFVLIPCDAVVGPPNEIGVVDWPNVKLPVAFIIDPIVSHR